MNISVLNYHSASSTDSFYHLLTIKDDKWGHMLSEDDDSEDILLEEGTSVSLFQNILYLFVTFEYIW